MPIIRRENPYQGVNAHLHSLLQNSFAGWEEFHGIFISDMTRAIDTILPARYRASAQRSLQITSLSAEVITQGGQWLVESDVSINQPQRVTSGSEGMGTATASAPTMTIPFMDAYQSAEEFLRAVAIVDIEDKREHSTPVAWIEIISPTNKPPGAGYAAYATKRADALAGGIVFVEVDLLHESRPVQPRLFAYPQKAGSTPYYVTLTDPRRPFQINHVEIYEFRVDEPFPRVRIPLLDDDSVIVDFGRIYQQSFSSLRAFWEVIDYESEPVHMERYSLDDQTRIRGVMAMLQGGKG
jgi:Tfp pilus assembly protein PilZ